MAVTPFFAQLAPSAASLTDMHTCPVGVAGEVGHMAIANRSATPTTFRVSVARAGAADATSQYLAYDKTVLGNAVERVEAIALTPNDVVRVYATLATLSFNLSGLQIPD